MIIGVGIDSVLINRIKENLNKFGDKFEKKIFTKVEILKANSFKNKSKKISFFAKRFAAKEAFSKACGLGIGRGVNFLDIEIFNDELGKPEIRILNKKEKFLQSHFNCKKLKFHLSLTDEVSFATAFVIIEKNS